ncbi:MAG: putative Dynein heavy chain [Streblomastix strix]|uniref:Putative Dynein heavy chain n=1 Tax=Streblomastix strix TaxID=222440 RepID=A0A5J4VXP1_9EUKA|nr:MAG: putative Dynein heavy chain [Streblomastix strix]
MERRRTGIVGSPPGSYYVVFVDDLNMPKLEIYGAQPPIELLRQFIDHGGWYVKKDSTTIPFIKIEDVQIVSAMGPPGGDSIRGLANPIVSATLDVYHTIAKELLPTPTKSHYTFNLRDQQHQQKKLKIVNGSKN